ncbi:hypothetical protein [Beggiatoa leptomitoformis]|uniref:Uncharacterized protein n=1 Tax=Beggiatoa leptomitoformis TaxID=288004 RepID=A0A2N9YH17_9GAMM|nr:hypothetical protein [Beggiatoa leptomitoformis]ALG67959.1 hypothetical protein AL038_09875 [Beggiatoa leptomitoformis]AUI69763.1 hypothetical protein BLE401_14405 [Beggiatoa leptomitoformis]
MRYYLSLIGISLTALLINGCSTTSTEVKPEEWKTIERTDKAVWADDASDIAVVSQSFEQQQDNKRNITHRLFIQNADGSNKHEITPQARENLNGEIYYMKQAGYLVVESLLDNGVRQFNKILLDGREILIIETPNKDSQPCREESQGVQVFHTVLPSPDGQILANIYSPECGAVSVDFLFANNLNITSAQYMNITEPLIATWHKDGYIILTNASKTNAWRVSMQESQPVPIPPPACVSPVTTSSNIASDGRKIIISETGELTIENGGTQSAFGCQ